MPVTASFSGIGSLYSDPGFGYQSDNTVGYGFRGIGMNGGCSNVFQWSRDDYPTYLDGRIIVFLLFALLNFEETTKAMFSMFFMLCDMGAKERWRKSGLRMLASTWGCLFTFYVQEILYCKASGYECGLGGAGVTQVFNLILLIVICVLFFILPSPGAEDDVDTNEDDGSKKNEDDEEMDRDASA